MLSLMHGRPVPLVSGHFVEEKSRGVPLKAGAEGKRGRVGGRKQHNDAASTVSRRAQSTPRQILLHEPGKPAALFLRLVAWNITILCLAVLS